VQPSWLCRSNAAAEASRRAPAVGHVDVMDCQQLAAALTDAAAGVQYTQSCRQGFQRHAAPTNTGYVSCIFIHYLIFTPMFWPQWETIICSVFMAVRCMSS